MSNSTSRAFHNTPKPVFQEKVSIPIIQPETTLPIESGNVGETYVPKTLEDWMKENGFDKEVVHEEKSFLQKLKELILKFKP